MPGFEVIGKEERDAVLEIFDDGGTLFAHGFHALRKGRYRVREFERQFAEHVRAKYAVAVSSGTAGLKVALKAAGVGPGDEVITQDFTFVASVEAIVDCGAVPLLARIDKTLNMDPRDVERRITKRTKAILPVHMLGVPADMDPLMRLAHQAGLAVVEDNCESLGARYDRRWVGTLGDLGAFSFDFGKVITSGEGGIVTTNSEELFKLAREYHDHGHEYNPSVPRNLDTRREPGFNYRMTEMQAAVGMAQLQKLDYILEVTKRHHAELMKGLRELRKFEFRAIPANAVDMCDTIIFFLPSAKVARAFVGEMEKKKLGTKNVPDALDWHFAGTWHHVFRHFGMTKEQLERETGPSRDLLYRAVALPIMVKYDVARITYILESLQEIACRLL